MDEVPDGCIGAELTPAEYLSDETKPPRVPLSELHGDGDAFVLGEEALLGQAAWPATNAEQRLRPPGGTLRRHAFVAGGTKMRDS